MPPGIVPKPVTNNVYRFDVAVGGSGGLSSVTVPIKFNTPTGIGSNTPNLLCATEWTPDGSNPPPLSVSVQSLVAGNSSTANIVVTAPTGTSWTVVVTVHVVVTYPSGSLPASTKGRVKGKLKSPKKSSPKRSAPKR